MSILDLKGRGVIIDDLHALDVARDIIVGACPIEMVVMDVVRVVT